MANIFDQAAQNDRRRKKETEEKILREVPAPTKELVSVQPDTKKGRFSGRKAVNFGIDADNDEKMRYIRFKTGKTVSDIVNEALAEYFREY